MIDKKTKRVHKNGQTKKLSKSQKKSVVKHLIDRLAATNKEINESEKKIFKNILDGLDNLISNNVKH